MNYGVSIKEYVDQLNVRVVHMYSKQILSLSSLELKLSSRHVQKVPALCYFRSWKKSHWPNTYAVEKLIWQNSAMPIPPLISH